MTVFKHKRFYFKSKFGNFPTKVNFDNNYLLKNFQKTTIDDFITIKLEEMLSRGKQLDNLQIIYLNSNTIKINPLFLLKHIK
jgi:hypothetical protein